MPISTMISKVTWSGVSLFGQIPKYKNPSRQDVVEIIGTCPVSDRKPNAQEYDCNEKDAIKNTSPQERRPRRNYRYF